MEYSDVFRHRGQAYDLAMNTYPNAMDKEFYSLFSRIPIKNNETILDVPSLGGYLKKYCLEDTKVLSLDFSQSINNIPIVSAYEKWNIPDVDRIVCSASIHHIQNLNLFLENMSSHLKKGGFLHIADVSLNSNISIFLDEFVGKYTSTGEHKGLYYNWNNIKFPTSLSVLSITDIECPWVFQSKDDMVNFCKLLFDLQNISDEDLLNGLQKYVGYTNTNNNINLNWHLTYVDLQSNRE
jgi:SAM-dependent methyltransferase